ncbi:hypothetical protein CAEBREN_31444 [Caenorhabditis brenneri]|uniref:Uncharacterized protein n=2 Tax=Caenorhabditis brenneri TaxID=135651 RepID=G0P3Y8_CAEBE|nr:hypothetical protein CAEBREN_31444 [Caenorhabditis brenneri]
MPIPHMPSPYTNNSHLPQPLHSMHTTNSSLEESPPFHGFIPSMLLPPCPPPQISTSTPILYNNLNIFNTPVQPPPPPQPPQQVPPPSQPTPKAQPVRTATVQPTPPAPPPVNNHQTHQPTGSGGGIQHNAAGQILTTAMDSCQQISHVLQCYQQGGEDSEFVRKAIESLVKKLKDKRIELDSLITAITSNGKQPTGCVTIQRSLDGRLQVAGRKGVPHVVYARIWRWPKVSKNELVKLVQCQTSADHPDNICINPYHYERVVSNRITSADQSLHGDVPKEYLGGESGMMETNGYGDWPNTPPENNYNGFTNNQHPSPQLIQQPAASEVPIDLNQIVVPTPLQPLDNWCSIIYYELDTQIGETFKILASHLSMQYSCASEAPIDEEQIMGGTPLQPLDNWCSIIYYELDTQIGETFKVSALDHGKVVVDGGMDPHGENEGRFCLGALSNVHRTEASEKARIHIGGGVELTCHADGNVSITSNCKIFVRSGYLDYSQGSEYSSKAHRFTPNETNFTVFDIRWAYMQMLRRSESSNEAVRAQAAAVAGYAPMSVMPVVMPDSGVDRMRRDFCTIAISFVKAWGDVYQRKTIKETPCWIEVTLHRPLQLLDQLLKNSSQFGSS